MKVIALDKGFFDGAPIEKGDTFDVPDGRKAAWYAPLDAVPKPKTPPAKEAPRALSEMGKEKAKSFVEAHKDKADLA